MADNNRPDVYIADGALKILEDGAETHRSRLQSAAGSLNALTDSVSVFGNCPSGQALSQAFTARAQGGSDSWEGVISGAQEKLDEIIGIVKRGHHAITEKDIEAAQALAGGID